MEKFILKSFKKLFYGGVLITIVLFSCSESSENYNSKATDTRHELTINSNDRGYVSPNVTYVDELQTTIFSNPKTHFYFYKWKVISGNVTIDLPNSSITTITVKDGNAVIEPIIYAFDPNDTSGIDLEAIQSLGDHDYAFINNSKKWSDAHSFCSNNGGYLATITSSGENNFVHTIRGGTSKIWLGGRRNTDSLDFYWITGEEFDYEKWRSHEPNNSGGGEFYIEMRSDGGWNDEDNENRAFVCEWGEY